MLDLSKILKDIRTTKIILDHSIGSEAVRNKINHTENNLIDLEEGLSESESHLTEQSSEPFERNEKSVSSPATLKTQDSLMGSQSKEMKKMNKEILKSLNKNIVRRPTLRIKKK